MSKLISSDIEKDVRKNQIVLLVTSYYEKLDFLHYEPLDLLIDKSLDLFLDSDLSIDEINEKLVDAIANRKKALDDRYDNDKVRDNHETIYGKLEQFAREFKKAGMDYQLAGALCGYIKYDEESDRVHDDIDFMLNEDDMDKFRSICIKLGLHFFDNRMNSPKVLKNNILSDEHEVIAKDPNSDFHVGIFPYERKDDGTVIVRGYYHDEDNKPCAREEIYSPELANEIFGGEEVEFRGTPIIITPPEHIYNLKSYTKHEKDLHDIMFLEDKIDRDKLLRMSILSRDGLKIQNVRVKDVKKNLHNPYNEDDDDLGLMLVDDEPINNNEFEKEGAKVLVKKNKQQEDDKKNLVGIDEEGFISNTIITTLAIITFVLCFIGIAIIYLVQM